ncbi:MAG: polysaccharide biosynthesis/export family protein [Terriglobales bacterium]
MRTLCACVLLVFLLQVGVFGQQAENTALPPSAASGPVSPDEPARTGLISIGDMLDISVYGVPELSQKARVNNAGNIYLPLINYVRVADLSIADAQALIEKQFAEGGYLKNPHVSITITEFAGGVSVMGEVARPGIYPLLGTRRLFDVLAAAGGTTDKAGQVVTITHRDRPDEPENVVLSIDPSQQFKANVKVSQGDTVVVSTAGVVYVVGQVNAPAGFVMERSSIYTVLKAIAMAHGPQPNAALDRTKIIRKTSDGQQQEIPVLLSKVLASQAPDIPLQANDIVFVPSSAGKNAARKSLDVAIQLITGVSIIRATR